MHSISKDSERGAAMGMLKVRWHSLRTGYTGIAPTAKSNAPNIA